MADFLDQFTDTGLAPEAAQPAEQTVQTVVQSRRSGLQPEQAPLASGEITNRPPQPFQMFGEPSQALTLPAEAPLTQQALTGSKKFIAENVREGVPLETTDPGKYLGYLAYPHLRAMLGRAGTIKDQQAVLEERYGAKNVRLDKKGEDFIVTVPDKEGKPRDIKLRDMEQMTVGDLAALSGTLANTLGAVVGVGGGRRLPLGLGQAEGLLGFTRDLVSGAIGSQAMDVISRAGIRAFETKQPVNIGELAQEEFQDVLPDVLVGYGMGGGLKTMRGISNFLQAPFSFARQPIHEAGLQAMKDLERETGIKLLYDPGEATGFPLFAMGREYIRKHPAAAALQNEFDTLQNSRIAAFKDYLFGGSVSDEEAGRNLIARLQAVRDASENTVNQAKQLVGTRAQNQIQSLVPGTAEVRPTETGERARQAIMARAESITGEKNALYARVQELPEAQQPIFPTAGVEKTMRDIKARLPDRTKITESITYDQYGNPRVESSEGKELIREFVPPEVAKFVDTKFDKEMPLQKMIEMRNLLWDRYIPEGEATPGISTRYLGEVSHAITESIEKTVENLPSGELKKRLVAANDFYKNHYLKLKESGIQDLFHAPSEGTKYVNPEDVIARIQNSPTTYKRTLELLGPTSKEAGDIRRSVFDDLLYRSRDAIDNTQIDAKKLLANIESMQANKNTREIFADAIGTKANDLARSAKVLGAAKGSLPMDEVRAALRGTPEAGALDSIVRAQESRDKLLLNQLVKKATVGELDLNTENPEKLVNAMFNVGTKSDIDTLAAWAHTDPAFERQLQQKTIEKFFHDASTAKEFEAKLVNEAGTPTEYGKKFKTLIGPRNWKLISDYVAYEKPRDYAAQLGSGTGMLTKGSIIGKFIRTFGEGAEALSNEAKSYIGAKAISATLVNPQFREMLQRASTAKDFKDLGLAVAASTPFIGSLAENMPEGDIRSFLQGFRRILHADRKPVPTEPPPIAPGQNFMDQFR